MAESGGPTFSPDAAPPEGATTPRAAEDPTQGMWRAIIARFQERPGQPLAWMAGALVSIIVTAGGAIIVQAREIAVMKKQIELMADDLSAMEERRNREADRVDGRVDALYGRVDRLHDAQPAPVPATPPVATTEPAPPAVAPPASAPNAGTQRPDD